MKNDFFQDQFKSINFTMVVYFITRVFHPDCAKTFYKWMEVT